MDVPTYTQMPGRCTDAPPKDPKTYWVHRCPQVPMTYGENIQMYTWGMGHMDV